jgi:hypothetical protein
MRIWKSNGSNIKRRMKMPKWYYSSKPYNDLETKDFHVLNDGTCRCLTYKDGDVVYDDNNEPVKAKECDGSCGKDNMEHFVEYAKQWFEEGKHRYFVYGFPRWDGRHDGEIIAKDAEDFLWQLTKGKLHIWWLFHREPKKPEEKKYNKTVLRFLVSGHDVPIKKWVQVEKDSKPWVEYY